MNNNQSFEDFLNIDYQSFSRYLFSFSGNEFGIVGALVGYLLCQKLDIDEQNSLGNFLELVGQMILAIAAQNQVKQNDNNQQDHSNSNDDDNNPFQGIFKSNLYR